MNRRDCYFWAVMCIAMALSIVYWQGIDGRSAEVAFLYICGLAWISAARSIP